MKLYSRRASSVFNSAVFASFKLYEGSTQTINPNPWLATYPKVIWSMILKNSRQKKHQTSSSFFACHPSLDLNICPKDRHGCRPFFVKPPHKESKLWSDASVSVSQANKIFFVVLNLSQGRESWVDLVENDSMIALK